MTSYTGDHQLNPHPDAALAKKGWLRCVLCGREVHGTTWAGGEWERCAKAETPTTTRQK